MTYPDANRSAATSEGHETNNEFRPGAIAWLRREPATHTLWVQSWQEVWEAAGKHDAELSELARAWLSTIPPSHASWAYVWRELWEALGPEDEPIALMARNWLEAVPVDHGSWGHVWQALSEAANWQDGNLNLRGEAWLQHVSGDHGSWPRVWRALWRIEPGRTERRAALLPIALAWLTRPKIRNPEWTLVWKELGKDCDSMQAELAGIAELLLLHVPPQDPDRIRRKLHTWKKRHGNAAVSGTQIPAV